MYNKRNFHKVNDKKVLRKVKKQWITVSLALFMMITGGTVATHVTASANDSINQTSVTVNQPQTGQLQADKVTMQASQLHAALVQHADQQQMRLGAHHGPRYVRSHFKRTNSRRQLKRSGFYNVYSRRVPAGISRHLIYNKYAPNNRKARIPRRFRLLNNTAWLTSTPWYARTHKGMVNLYLYSRKHRNWMFNPSIRKRTHKVRKHRRVSRYRRHSYHYAWTRNRRRAKYRRRVTRRHNYRTRRHASWRTHQVTIKRHRRQHSYVYHPARPRYTGYYVLSDGNNSDMFMTNSDVQDMSNQNKASDSDFSDDYVTETEDSPLKAQVVNTDNLDGYQLDQINHQVSGHDGNVWVFPQELSHSSSDSFDTNDAFNNMIQKIIQDHKNYQKQLSDEAFNRTFTSDERAQVNNIKSQYNYLMNNENSSDDMYSTKPDLSNGVVGSDSPAYIQHVVDWINFYRSIYGLLPVSATSKYNQSAQYGADDCAALGDIVHGLNGMSDKPANVSSDAWQEGIDATDSSNLDEGNTEPSGVVYDYFTDSQSDNVPGHRCWILDPGLQHIGVGQDDTYNDLHVFDSDDNGSNQTLYYPNSPVFPYEWATAGGAWSLMLPNDAQVNSPQVTVTDETTGQNVPITTTNVSSDYGNFGTVNFLPDMDDIKPNHAYNITVNSASGTWNWTTKLFKLTND